MTLNALDYAVRVLEIKAAFAGHRRALLGTFDGLHEYVQSHLFCGGHWLDGR